MHVTTAASPLELALFCDSSAGTSKQPDGDLDDSEYMVEGDEEWSENEEWIDITDQWVPVSVSMFAQRNSFIKLRRVLNFNMLNHVAYDPETFLKEERYERLVLCVFSSMESERIAF